MNDTNMEAEAGMEREYAERVRPNEFFILHDALAAYAESVEGIKVADVVMALQYMLLDIDKSLVITKDGLPIFSAVKVSHDSLNTVQ